MNLVLAAAQSVSVPGDISANIGRHIQLAKLGADHGANLIVFPELSLTGYELSLAAKNIVSSDDPRLDALKHLARKARVSIVVGAPMIAQEQKLHIGALALLPDGSVLTYTKQHLHPGEEAIFTPGLGGSTFVTGGATVALAICADTSHPEHAAHAAERGANIYAAGVLVTEKGYQADAGLMQRYARQHHMAVLMANHGAPTGGWIPAGRSAIWSEEGNLVIASNGRGDALVLARMHDASWTGSILSISVR
jgi:predicted amidohydrolase